jgi:histidine triad (HIT) family protein
MPDVQTCIFCKIIAGEIPAEAVYSDEQTYAFLVIEPVSEGHTVVVPRVHSDSLEHAAAVDAAALMATVQQLGPRIRDAVGADAYNVGINCGTAAGQIVPHTHVHIIPRHSDDGLVHWPHSSAAAVTLAATAHKIRTAIAP